MSRLQQIETLSDFESFGPSNDAVERDTDDLCEMHHALETNASHSKLKVSAVHQNRAVALVLQYNENPENVLRCPIDHSGNSKVESTQEQSWMLYAPLNVPFVIAFNNSGSFIIEPHPIQYPRLGSSECPISVGGHGVTSVRVIR